MIKARIRNSNRKTGSIKNEEIPENFVVLMELRRLFTQTRPSLRNCGGLIAGSLDSLFASSINRSIIARDSGKV